MNEKTQAQIGRRAALYARVSSERQAEKDLSIPAQLKALRDFATRRGWTVQTEYVDEARSARSADRPQFQEMISAARQKKAPFDCILVWKLSRFARNREDSIIYKKLLRKHGVEVVSINEQIDDSPSGQLLEGIIEVIDEFYSANLSHDTIRGMKENAQRGFLNGSTPPYGFEKLKVRVGTQDKYKLTPDKAEAPVVRRMFRLCLENKGAKEIARILNEDGIRTRRGRLWEINAIHYILRNETYTGVLIFNRVHKNSVKAVERAAGQEVRVENAHPAIIERDTFRKAQKEIASRSPARIHPRTFSSQYLLSGLVRCGRCGANMAGCAAKSSRFFYYACHNRVRRGLAACNAKLVNRDRLEQSVVARIKERVLTDENLAQLVRLVNEEINGDREQVGDQLLVKDTQVAALNARLDKLYAALETGKFDMDDLAPRVKDLRAQIEVLKTARIGLELQQATQEMRYSDGDIRRYAADMRKVLENGSLFERKAFLRHWIRRVTLDQRDGGTIEYVLPLGPGKENDRLDTEGGHPLDAVLSLTKAGGANGIRTRDLRLDRAAC